MIDTRPLSAYQEGHIATAVSFPALPLEVQEVERVKKLIEFIKSYIKEYLRYFLPSNDKAIESLQYKSGVSGIPV